MRRLALSVGALVAAISFSACGSADSGSVAAEVGEHQLTMDQLSDLSGGSTDGVEVRKAVKTWIEVVAVTDDATGMTTPAELSARKLAALEDLLTQFGDEAQATYELGINGSPLLCLSAIPLDTTVTGATVLDELAAGTTFADAAKKYSSDATLADSGGVVKNTDGVECIDPAKFNEALVTALLDAGAEVGQPVAIVLNSQEVVLLLRPFDELTLGNDQLIQLSANEMGAALREKYDAVDIRVAGRIGTWDGDQADVIATGAAATTVPAPGTTPVTTPDTTG
jgi:hypothetical protein